MSTTFVPGATQCANSCEVRTTNYKRDCDFTNGDIHAIAVTQCGITIKCLSDLDEICQLYDTGQLDVIPAIGSVPEPEKTVIESPYPCKRDQLQYWTQSYPAEMAFEYDNITFWKEICQGKFGQIVVVLKNGLAKTVQNLRAADPVDYSEDGIHKVKVDIIERITCGIKDWEPTGIPLYDVTCLE